MFSFPRFPPIESDRQRGTHERGREEREEREAAKRQRDSGAQNERRGISLSLRAVYILRPFCGIMRTRGDEMYSAPVLRLWWNFRWRLL